MTIITQIIYLNTDHNKRANYYRTWFFKSSLKIFKMKRLHLNHTTAEKHFNNFLDNGKQSSMMNTNTSTKETFNSNNLQIALAWCD